MQLLIGEILDRARRTDPNRLAATLGNEELTFAEVDNRSKQLANVFKGLGVGCGDIVVWWSDISLQTIEGFMALQRLGAIFAPINPRFSVDEAVPVLQYFSPRLLVVDVAHVNIGVETNARTGIALAVIGQCGTSTPGHDLTKLSKGASTIFSPTTPLRETDPHAIFLTSGSTGAPKGVVLSHRASWLRAAWMTELGMLPNGQPGEAVSMFPLFHWAGWSSLLYAWQNHTPVHYVYRAEPEQLLGTVQRRRADILYCIPGIWRRIFDDHRLAYDLSSLQVVTTGTSAVSTGLLHEIKERFPGTLTHIGYGSTEGGGASNLHDQDLFRKPGSVGRPNKFLSMRLAEDGEVCVQSAALMDGYLNRPAETTEVLRDGWYHMGDLGTFDDEGYLWLIGRKREIIRSGGETIAPVEIEEILRTFPAIKDVAVIGMPDESWGEVVTAVLVLEPGKTCPTVQEIRSSLKQTAPHKHPRRMVVVDAIPRTPATGQVRRGVLRDILLRLAGGSPV